MLDNLPQTVKQEMVKTLSEFELKHQDVPSGEFDRFTQIGFVNWKIRRKKDKLPLYLGEPKEAGSDGFEQRSAYVVFTDGTKAIVMTPKELFDSKFAKSIIAHEVAHYELKHHERKEPSLPNLYKEENLQAYNDGDSVKHTVVGTKAIVDGGYLEIELAADLFASNFVGCMNLIMMRLDATIGHPNPLLRIEGLNRINELHRRLVNVKEDNFLPKPGYELYIDFWTSEQIKENSGEL